MFLEIHNLHKTFAHERVLRGVDCAVEKHETLSILGRSGSGKTTLLKIIAGLETADAGDLLLEGKSLAGVPPQKRGIVYLYQEPLLFPHLNVFDNIAFGLRLQGAAASDIDRRVSEMLDNLGLNGHVDKMPDQLSGGQRQRVAFGRAIIVNPSLLLLDEPFANLDVDIRASMQRLFKRLTRAFRITSLFVTHNLKEALLMGDRLAHLREGRLKTYTSRQAFIEDPAAGVQSEIEFWTSLQ